jgi:hypothetical protein
MANMRVWDLLHASASVTVEKGRMVKEVAFGNDKTDLNEAKCHGAVLQCVQKETERRGMQQIVFALQAVTQGKTKSLAFNFLVT